MRAVPLALLVGLAATAAAQPSGPPSLVHVRIEGDWEPVWDGDVVLPASVRVTAANSGRVYDLPAATPFGALVAAASSAGIGLTITDEFDDFVVYAVEGEHWWGTKWWDYRVNWVQPNYGAHAQWLAWGPALDEGDEILWYVDQPASVPLRASDLGPLPSGCGRAALVETLVADDLHDAGEPWPELHWQPVPYAELGGAAYGQSVVAGIALAETSYAGRFWAEDPYLPVTPLAHYVRSNPIQATCPA